MHTVLRVVVVVGFLYTVWQCLALVLRLTGAPEPWRQVRHVGVSALLFMAVAGYTDVTGRAVELTVALWLLGLLGYWWAARAEAGLRAQDTGQR